jgi:LmbE family N-acetylglucosaminyl deacetylase
MRVLAISAHPDDETLGCGGTLLKHRAQGDELFWLIASTRREARRTRENIAAPDAYRKPFARLQRCVKARFHSLTLLGAAAF